MSVAPFGLLNIDKPRGETSRWVVNQIQRAVRPAKTGHAGTLDPIATGVLIVCVGQATRLVEYVQMMRKRYRAEFQLGRTSATEDIEGEINELQNPPVPSIAEIERAAKQLTGEIMQRPPAFSALKVAGHRSYDLARRGQAVELAPRPVTIFSIETVSYVYPQLILDIQCSGGTYVRSIGRDLAESLGTGAVMSALVRNSIGSFRLDDALDPSQLTADTVAQHLIPPPRAVEQLQSIALNEEQLNRLRFGQHLDLPALVSIAEASASESPDFAAFDAYGNLAAILQRRPDGLFGTIRNFVGQ
jgi:tRNA pseudouridine55 synthase